MCVVWETVTDTMGLSAWTAGQLRAAIAHLADDQIIVDAGHGRIGWGDGHGMDRDPLFALECHWHTTDVLHIRPNRPNLRGQQGDQSSTSA